VDRGDLVRAVLDDLDGRVVVITGASKGVGRGIARYLAQCSVRLVVSVLNNPLPDTRIGAT
jgi:NAD(P)-dependent dehydrogenase (short-subunit alcohol dehydrogenase family)